MVTDEYTARVERARQIGLFRYQLIREPADPALTTRERGRMVRALAAQTHVDPFGATVRVSRDTLDRWIRLWRQGGFDALVPVARQARPRMSADVIELALALKRENPARTAAQVRRILLRQLGWSPTDRTVQRWFIDHDLIGSTGGDGNGSGGARRGGGSTAVFGRFEAQRPNELWTGDALHGPVVGGKRTYLFAFIDDHSRAIVGHRFGYAEDTVRLAAALRPALAARGVPERIYVDNGSAFVTSWLLRSCAVLGIRLTHSTPGRPQGRGKIERFFKTVRDQFLVEIAGTDGDGAPGRHLVSDLLELNRLFTAWVETVYHRQVHSETGQEPLARYLAGRPPTLPDPDVLAEAFRWQERRLVRKTSTVELFGNVYEVDPVLVGRKVDLVFDPFDLTRIDVRLKDTSYGLAVPHHVTRNTHPMARPSTPPPAPTPTGINYTQLLDDAHAAEQARGIAYAALAEGRRDTASRSIDSAGELPGQLDLIAVDLPTAGGKEMVS